MGLEEEIQKKRAEIHTDAYSMSVGEWLNLYADQELDIHPEFQRFFRWTPIQKTKLIESILLGIPIPPIFVSQRTDGVWDVVDGLQRLSTIFQFAGILKDEDKSVIAPLVLEGTKYLPSLQGKVWESAANPKRALTQTQRLEIKRAKIDVKIVLKQSGESSKYELFQRLNTGGSPLSDQELRNCILVMVNREMYSWMRKLSSQSVFKECVALTDKAIEEQYDLELVLRFLIFRTMKEPRLKAIGDVGEFLTDEMQELAKPNKLDLQEEEAAFSQTFAILNKAAGSNSFKRYDASKKKFMGGFLLSAYEVVALGIGHNNGDDNSSKHNNLEIIKALWSNPQFENYSGSGVRASLRIPKLIPLGRKLFKP